MIIIRPHRWIGILSMRYLGASYFSRKYMAETLIKSTLSSIPPLIVENKRNYNRCTHTEYLPTNLLCHPLPLAVPQCSSSFIEQFISSSVHWTYIKATPKPRKTFIYIPHISTWRFLCFAYFYLNSCRVLLYRVF